MLYIKEQEMKRVMQQALENVGCDAARAKRLAHIITENTMDGSATHGANRFPRLVAEVASGVVSLEGEMTKVAGFGGLEVWDGGFGFGVLNAEQASERAVELAREHGIGCVSLRNSNHWLRPGRYGWNTAKAGMIGICWSNTSGNMPVWGARDVRMGNNPIVMAVPSADGPVLVDMAMSQFANGKLEVAKQKGESLPMPCGWDEDGNLTLSLYECMMEHCEKQDIIIQAAAPADYRVEHIADQKIKKQSGESFTLTLVENPDIAKAVGQRKQPGQVLVGFAAETQNVMANAQSKLEKKNLDLIVANDVTEEGAGFGVDTNIVTLITKAGSTHLPKMIKREVADRILDQALLLHH